MALNRPPFTFLTVLLLLTVTTARTLDGLEHKSVDSDHPGCLANIRELIDHITNQQADEGRPFSICGSGVVFQPDSSEAHFIEMYPEEGGDEQQQARVGGQKTTFGSSEDNMESDENRGIQSRDKRAISRRECCEMRASLGIITEALVGDKPVYPVILTDALNQTSHQVTGMASCRTLPTRQGKECFPLTSQINVWVADHPDLSKDELETFSSFWMETFKVTTSCDCLSDQRGREKE